MHIVHDSSSESDDSLLQKAQSSSLIEPRVKIYRLCFVIRAKT